MKSVKNHHDVTQFEFDKQHLKLMILNHGWNVGARVHQRICKARNLAKWEGIALADKVKKELRWGFIQ